MKKKIILGLMLLLALYCKANALLDESAANFYAAWFLKSDAPVVKITSPADGKKYKYNTEVTVEVNATDTDGEIYSVEFFFDNYSVGIDTVPPYTIDFNAFKKTNNGIIKAVATDDKGLTGSDSITIIVADNIEPIVKIIKPPIGAIIKANDLLTIEADASDADGDLAKVDFIIDGKFAGSSSTAPYSITWKAEEGAAEVIAVAYDDNWASSNDKTTILVDEADFFVRIKQPKAGYAYITGDVIAIEADIYNKSAIQKVSSVAFFVNDKLIGIDSISPYSVNWISKTGVTMVKALATSLLKKVADSLVIRVNDTLQNQPPVVRFQDYYNGSIVQKNEYMGMSAIASDPDGKINSVSFFMNGLLVGTDTVGPSPYFCSWKAIKGLAEITAIATDNKGMKSKLSEPYKIYNDNKSPQSDIKIVQPVNGSVYKTGDKLTIEAYHNGHSRFNYYKRSAVNFFINNVLIGTANEYPYSIEWTGVKGQAVITAVSMDFQDIIADSITIVIDDNNQNVKPAVNINGPSNGAIYDPGDIIEINARASDMDGSISSVAFFVNGVSIAIDSIAPYQVKWTGITGNATVKAVAKDNKGSETADSLRIRVIQNTAPLIKITAPVNGQVISGGNTVSIEVNATDTVGKIMNVEFFVNNKSIRIDDEYPYYSDWSLVNGDAVIKVIATDEKGLKAADSVIIHVTTETDSTQIKIKSPLASSSYKIGDVITLEAEVSNVSLLKVDFVEFRINQFIRILDSIAPYKVQWTATQAEAGLVEIEAFPIHLDTDGSTTILDYGEAVTILLKQSDFEIKISKPLKDGSYLYANNLLEIEAMTSDSKNNISDVKFFVDGTLVGTDKAYPYTASWLMKKGVAMIVAVANNDKGKSTSDTLFIDVKPGSLEVEIQSPFNGQKFLAGDVIAIETSVQMNYNVEDHLCHVEFFVNNVSIGIDSKGPGEGFYEAEWIAKKGYAVIKAVAWMDYDKLYVDSVIIKVNDTTKNLPPTVEILKPVNGTIYKPGDKITIDVKAADADGDVKSVSFFVKDSLIGIDSIAPYMQSWTAKLAGKVILTAKAVDNLAAVGVSPPVEIIISPISNIVKPTDEDTWISIYPNPAATVLNIEATENAIVQLLAVDGKRIVLQASIQAKQKHIFDTGMLANGSYILKAYNNKFTSFQKIIIQK